MKEKDQSFRAPLFAGITSKDALVDFLLHAILISESKYGEDNIDADYPPPFLFAGATNPVQEQVDYLKFVLKNSSGLYNTFSSLEDTASRELLLKLILFRILGYKRVRLPLDHDAYFAAREKARALPSRLSFVDVAGFRHYEFRHQDTDIRLDCLSANIFFSFLARQYYFHRRGIVIAPRPGDAVIDAGGCYGDTAVEFATNVGPAGHVYVFELLQPHLDIIDINLRQNPHLSNITVFPCGLSNQDQAGQPIAGECNPGFQPPESAPFRSLDSLVQEQRIPRVDFVKMDIEGGELRALEGAAETIRRFQPRLAISVYHHPADYVHIPQLIRKLLARYRLFLDNYTISDGETVLYGTCE
jgi:FkbM family methyltransferase